MPLLAISQRSPEAENQFIQFARLANAVGMQDYDSVRRIVQGLKFGRAMRTWKEIDPDSFRDLVRLLAQIELEIK